MVILQFLLTPVAQVLPETPSFARSMGAPAPVGLTTTGKWDTSVCVSGERTALWYELERPFTSPSVDLEVGGRSMNSWLEHISWEEMKVP